MSQCPQKSKLCAKNIQQFSTRNSKNINLLRLNEKAGFQTGFQQNQIDCTLESFGILVLFTFLMTLCLLY